jgi:hypothetical protein
MYKFEGEKYRNTEAVAKAVVVDYISAGGRNGYFDIREYLAEYPNEEIKAELDGSDFYEFITPAPDPDQFGRFVLESIAALRKEYGDSNEG